MLVPLCNCNRHFSFLPSKTLLNPPIPNCQYPNLQFKPLRRRFSVSASAETESQILPQSAIHRIAEKLRSLGYVEESTNNEPLTPGPNSPGEIFVPLPTRLPKYRVGHTLDSSWSTPENPVPEPGSGNVIQRFHEVRSRVMEEEERIRKSREGKKESVAPSLAELTLPEKELRRLRSEGIGLRKKLKLGKAGITEGIVNGIHERWRRNELVKITCEDICRMNMKRTHDLLERKTGGLVIWRSGSNIILYRGPNYKYPYFFTDNNLTNDSSSEESSDTDTNQRILSQSSKHPPITSAVESLGLNSSTLNSHPPLIQGVGLPNRVRFELPGEAQLAEEADALLEGLGPRYNDWWGYDPLPVDADLLPAVVPGYKRPFRLLPYGVKPKLTNDEMTTLKRLGRPLPCHFVLGRNRKHQGLAASIVKLWEKCEIAKIAVKRGVQNTNSELMAEELKRLTGGTLLSRDKEFIVFYRGKDFLPAAASSAIEERRRNGINVAKTNKIDSLNVKEHMHGTNEYAAEVEHNEENDKILQGRSERRKLKFKDTAMERTKTKLSMALEKKVRAEKLLEELAKEEICQPTERDKEGITEEERYMLRKVGLRMNAFLLLGRRGVFDGTIENMHLHWKYRELVKVCIGRRSIDEVHGVARTLEAESGGILVAVERVSKGYAIIVYRGKNYKRPASLRPQTLLSKREAMKRSLEAQRRESLKLHVLKLNRDIDVLKLRLDKNEPANAKQLTEDLEHGFVKEQEVNQNLYDEGEIFQEDPQSDYLSYFEEPANEEVNENHHGEGEIFQEDPQSDYRSYFEEPANEEVNENHYGEGEIFQEDPQSDYPSYFEEPANEETMECLETVATAMHPEDLTHTTKGSLDVVQQDLPADISSQSEVKGDYLFDVTQGLQTTSVVNKSEVSFKTNEQNGNVERSYRPRSQDRRSTSTSTYFQRSRGMESDVGYRKAELQPLIDRAKIERPSMMPFRESQLSNKERLLLRKQALEMKKRPVLAIGKSNVVSGVAKAINEHFQKYPLAIVNIKGRAKGTSIQEVIYNLEQATGAVFVSQEPSKVILYRGWGSGAKTDRARADSAGEEMMARPIVSPELISAIRLECGLNSSAEEKEG
ncbi:hypothetical protein RD792_004243 [Penstemon davidsonii]|uniref:CRM domain-containing protein n=1 Tax=Penstemon davidsonii TaxID=160366 RepID=A0ABR0DGW5_9LAMI|nr:hypothetical protein RD792_004243 [Penstemon davidsonii]